MENIDYRFRIGNWKLIALANFDYIFTVDKYEGGREGRHVQTYLTSVAKA